MAGRLIADIGGTSSRWAYLPKSGPAIPLGPFMGFNPASGDAAAFTERLLEQLVPALPGLVTDVVIYGAGCGAPARQERVRSIMASLWPQAAIRVHTDLLGAAIGSCGERSGLVLILGTGMNVGFYDGSGLRCPMPSLGPWLGDEGSGADLGRHLLRDLHYGLLPAELQQHIFPTPPSVHETVEQIHRGTAPQAWLASFAAGLAGVIEAPYAADLLEQRFGALAGLLARFFTPEERRHVFATGSVANGLQAALGPALEQQGMQLIAVVRDPLEGLVRHHLARLVS